MTKTPGAPAVIFLDSETTGLPKDYKAPLTDTANWPRMVQLAWLVHDVNGNLLREQSFIIKPEGFTIPDDVAAIHGISQARAMEEGGRSRRSSRPSMRTSPRSLSPSPTTSSSTGPSWAPSASGPACPGASARPTSAPWPRARTW